MLVDGVGESSRFLLSSGLCCWERGVDLLFGIGVVHAAIVIVGEVVPLFDGTVAICFGLAAEVG